MKFPFLRRLSSLVLLAFLVLPWVASGVQAESELNEAVEQSTLLVQLRQKLAQTEYRLFLLENNIELAQDGLEEYRSAINVLEDSLAELDFKLNDLDKQLLSVRRQKESQTLNQASLETELIKLQGDLGMQKDRIEELLPVLYKHQSTFYSEGQVNAFKVLASPGSISETLQQATYAQLFEDSMELQIYGLLQAQSDSKTALKEVRNKQADLQLSELQLLAEQERLRSERTALQEDLNLKNRERAVLEASLLSSDDRIEDLREKLEIYEGNIALMEQRFKEASVLLSSDELDLVTKIERDMQQQFEQSDAAQFLKLEWPVPMEGGITATYLDDAYQSYFGVAHRAIDIRVRQNTPILSPGYGVVQEVHYDPDSTNYAYVRVAYRMGVSIQFGHVSRVEVVPGQAVAQGDVLAYSGGAPGSIGAGPMTTGAHLHMELFQDGFHTDPFPYFPYEELNLDQLPEKYALQVEERLKANIRELTLSD